MLVMEAMHKSLRKNSSTLDFGGRGFQLESNFAGQALLSFLDFGGSGAFNSDRILDGRCCFIIWISGVGEVQVESNSGCQVLLNYFPHQ